MKSQNVSYTRTKAKGGERERERERDLLKIQLPTFRPEEEGRRDCSGSTSGLMNGEFVKEDLDVLYFL